MSSDFVIGRLPLFDSAFSCPAVRLSAPGPAMLVRTDFSLPQPGGGRQAKPLDWKEKFGVLQFVRRFLLIPLSLVQN